MDIGSIKINASKIEDGVWVDTIPEFGDLRLLVRGTSSFAYRDAIGRLSRNLPKNKRNDDGSVPAKELDRLTAQALAEGALLGWENVEIGGVAVPFSKERAVDLLTDPDYSKFADAVMFAAQKVNASAPDETALVGNSETVSSGK